MAIGFGAISAVSTSQTPTSVTLSGTNTLGIVFVQGDAAADNISAVTWNSVSMTKITAVQVPSDRWMSAWYIVNPASATTISFTGASAWRSYSFYYTGAKQSGQVDSSNTGTATAATNVAVATTIVATNCWTVMCTKDNDGTKTYTTSIGLMRVATDGGGLAISDSNATRATGSQSTTQTDSGGNVNLAGIAFSIAPAPSSKNLLLMGVGT